jgi:hypothetical protein
VVLLSPIVGPDGERVMQSAEPNGKVALMLCESLIHLLVEEGVLAKQKALEIIESVAELAREVAEDETTPDVKPNAAAIAETIAASFKLKD